MGNFHSASLALQQDQLALSATADNISNQNTAGYARRTVSWSNRDTVTLSGAAQMETPVVTVTAQRSSALDDAVVSATASSTSAATVKSALGILQSTFAIGSSGDEGSGINAAMSGFFAAVRSLAADPTSTSARQTAFAAAQSVAESFQRTGSALLQQAAGLNSTIQSAIGDVNQLTSSIAALNNSIANASGRADRDTLIDERTAQIQSLSELVGLQQTTSSDGSVSLFTTSGGALVVGNTSDALTTGTANGALQVYAQGYDVTPGLEGGSIGGALSARDGALADTQMRIDALATSFAISTLR